MNRLNDILCQGIENKLFSAAQLVVSDNHKNLVSLAIGKTRVFKSKNDFNAISLPVNARTLFDVASLTKPIATASLMMKAIEEKVFSIHQKLVSIDGMAFPPYLLSNTIGDLLSHQTELVAWADFHGKLPRRDDHENALRHVMHQIAQMPPREDGKSWCYSDLGFILLGMMLEMAYGMDLGRVFNQKIARPLGLEKDMMFVPLEHVNRELITATCPFEGAYIQGHPDDANARALTHIAGHAGLFANAEAIAAFVRALLSKDFPVIPEVIDAFIAYQSPRTPYALGWDRPTSDDSLSGRKKGDHVIGHLGFTGCSVWIDLDTQRSVTLLTNRTHLNQTPQSIAQLRRDIYKICWEL
ncbi:MAG: beta-lactamase family protein [Proteobacteria bacterium]|nr:beta-lactamase family protein [Pseudomonadota bacterium]